MAKILKEGEYMGESGYAGKYKCAICGAHVQIYDSDVVSKRKDDLCRNLTHHTRRIRYGWAWRDGTSIEEDGTPCCSRAGFLEELF